MERYLQQVCHISSTIARLRGEAFYRVLLQELAAIIPCVRLVLARFNVHRERLHDIVCWESNGLHYLPSMRVIDSIQESILHGGQAWYYSDEAPLDLLMPLMPWHDALGCPLYSQEGTPLGVLQLYWSEAQPRADHPAYTLLRLLAPLLGREMELEAVRRNQVAAEVQLVSLASYDQLTQLPNRDFFTRTLVQRCGEREPFALLVLDLNNLRSVNNSLDHDAGDEILRELPRRFQAIAEPGEWIARIGGDEFAFILPGIHSQQEAEPRLAQLQACLATPFMLATQQHYMSASFGVSLWPQDATNADELLSNAEQALGAAQQSHQTLCFFSQAMRSAWQNRLTLQRDLAEAIQRRQLQVVYQPVFDSKRQQVSKLEALVRWHHPLRGPISPADFIPLAEECGLIQQLGEWVLERACGDLLALQAAGYRGIKLALNRSTLEFQSLGPTGKEWLASLARAGVPPSDIIFEITESLLLENQSLNRQRLHALREAGCQIAIDDFGTGYSALSYLRTFPIDIIKIDRSFIQPIPQCEQSAQLLDGVIKLVHNLEIELVIEGVECVEQLDFLLDRGCQHIQGFYFCRPLPLLQLQEYLAQLMRSRGKVVNLHD